MRVCVSEWVPLAVAALREWRAQLASTAARLSAAKRLVHFTPEASHRPHHPTTTTTSATPAPTPTPTPTSAVSPTHRPLTRVHHLRLQDGVPPHDALPQPALLRDARDLPRAVAVRGCRGRRAGQGQGRCGLGGAGRQLGGLPQQDQGPGTGGGEEALPPSTGQPRSAASPLGDATSPTAAPSPFTHVHTPPRPGTHTHAPRPPAHAHMGTWTHAPAAPEAPTHEVFGDPRVDGAGAVRHGIVLSHLGEQSGVVAVCMCGGVAVQGRVLALVAPQENAASLRLLPACTPPLLGLPLLHARPASNRQDPALPALPSNWRDPALPALPQNPTPPPRAQRPAPLAPEPMSLRCAVAQGSAWSRPCCTARSTASCAIRRYVVHLPPVTVMRPSGSTVTMWSREALAVSAPHTDTHMCAHTGAQRAQHDRQQPQQHVGWGSQQGRRRRRHEALRCARWRTARRRVLGQTGAHAAHSPGSTRGPRPGQARPTPQSAQPPPDALGSSANGRMPLHADCTSERRTCGRRATTRRRAGRQRLGQAGCPARRCRQAQPQACPTPLHLLRHPFRRLQTRHSSRHPQLFQR